MAYRPLIAETLGLELEQRMKLQAWIDHEQFVNTLSDVFQ